MSWIKDDIWLKPYRVGKTLRIRLPRDFKVEDKNKLSGIEQGKSQMTREEAHKKLADLDYDTKEGIEYDLKVLEALGLIKFDEEKKDDLITVLRECRGAYNDNNEFIKALKKRGYKIVRKD